MTRRTPLYVNVVYVLSIVVGLGGVIATLVGVDGDAAMLAGILALVLAAGLDYSTRQLSRPEEP